MNWMQRAKAALTVMQGKGTVVCETNLRTGWAAHGIPADAGDGFAYNAEGRLYGDGITSERAVLQLSTAMACVRLLSQTIATLPIGIYRRNPDGSRESLPSNPLYNLLHNQPNADMTAVDFWQVMVAWMLLRGTSIAELDYIGGRLVAITPLYMPNLTWRRNTGGGWIFTYVDPDNGRMRNIPEDRLWKLPAFTLNGEFGISPICYGANVFGTAYAADQASRNVFANGLSASGFIQYGDSTKDFLTDENRTKLRSSVDGFSGSSRAGKTMILEGGMSYTQLSMNPEDAQMLETRSFNIEEICRWFGVPPTLVGHGDKTSNWGTGLEQQNLAFLTYNLRPWLSKIEQSIRRVLIPVAEKETVYAEFSVEGLLRADTAGRTAFWASALQNGYINRKTVAQKENLPVPPEGGEVYTVQAAMIPLDQLAKRAAAGAQPATAGVEGLPAEATVQETALNGAQVSALQALLTAAAAGTMPIDCVRAAIAAAFPLLTTEEINAMISPLVGFTPATAPAQVIAA